MGECSYLVDFAVFAVLICLLIISSISCTLKCFSSTFPCVLGLSEISKDSGLISGFIRDLTSEKQIQREVEEQHKLMTKIMDASFHALFVINSKGIIQMVNERSTKVLGWTKEQFIGHNISMIMPQEHAKQHDEYLRRYCATGFKRMIGKEREVLAKRKDG